MKTNSVLGFLLLLIFNSFFSYCKNGPPALIVIVCTLFNFFIGMNFKMSAYSVLGFWQPLIINNSIRFSLI